MIKIGSARIDENGNANWGKAGDQTGREVAEEPYYSHRLGLVYAPSKRGSSHKEDRPCDG